MLPYPETRVESVEDVLSGVSFPDPYRWLEKDTEEVRTWQRRQAEIARSYVTRWSGFGLVEKLVSHYSKGMTISLPRFAAGNWFWIGEKDGGNGQVVLVSETFGRNGKIVVDPTDDGRQPVSVVSWISPSPDGRILALGLCGDGSERNSIRLIDVATGDNLPDAPPMILMDNFTGGAQWLSDSSGFFFTALSGPPAEFEQRVYLHRRVSKPSTRQLDISWTTPKSYRMVTVSREGNYAVAIERILNPIPVAIARLDRDPLQWRPFVTSISGTVAGHLVGNSYLAITDAGAPRGRLVTISVDTPDPNDPSQWRELRPEGEMVLRTITPVRDVFYLTELVNAYAQVRIVDRDGNECGMIPLPAKGVLYEADLPLMNLVSRGHPDKFLFGFSTLVASPGIYLHSSDKPQPEMLQAPRVSLTDTVVEDRAATSADGTQIPYQLVRPRNSDLSKPQPTLIQGYGGFNVAFLPKFPGPAAAFVAAGGILVLPHLRGGGEFGTQWWHAGRKKNAQKSYDDLYAVAEHLISDGICSPQTLAVTGRSHGGLMAAVAVTQRPELWAVAIPRVPSLDQIGSCRYVYGRQAVVSERADVEDPDEVRRLATFSPYQLVRDGVCYPAIYISAGDTDPRCPPWHARKFAARMQKATSGNVAVLLHVWENTGHGPAADASTIVNEWAEWLAFVLQQVSHSASLKLEI